HRRETSEIAVRNESHVAGDRHPTQRAHRPHAECRKHEAGSAEAYAIDARQAAHPFVPPAVPGCAHARTRIHPAAPISIVRYDIRCPAPDTDASVRVRRLLRDGISR